MNIIIFIVLQYIIFCITMNEKNRELMKTDNPIKKKKDEDFISSVKINKDKK